MTIYKILCISCGGFLGSILRYKISSIFPNKSFPAGTVAVNLTGSFFLGMIFSLNSIIEINQYLFLFLTLGFAGAYTTFSTAIFEEHKLLENKEFKKAIIYMTASIALGFICASLGYWLIRLFLV
ncbi:putative fluoride ion transporter CrcB [Oxobacter pfennigii]|uniref:Fluoride-specific ion channel FluC n=1 Tax=Oxobacter pfennigii TaxID=36849 RepID=A0A0N8NTF4_9CLOT|nr:fluoride efflux transporter CrcB [Oxobacter pfennigii]KPU44680.1 putative fluoride ion transporter CrcB [Oxobacter pfennigii]